MYDSVYLYTSFLLAGLGTSDNATIAAPAGVVFVTVGNETVKVAVK